MHRARIPLHAPALASPSASSRSPFSPPYRYLLLLFLPRDSSSPSPPPPPPPPPPSSSSSSTTTRSHPSFTSAMGILSHPSAPLLILSRRFLRIDVIGLFALFRLRAGSIVRDASFAGPRKRRRNFSSQRRPSRHDDVTTLRAKRVHFVPTYVQGFTLAKRATGWWTRNMEIYARTFGFYGSLRGYEASTNGSCSTGAAASACCRLSYYHPR